MDPSAGRRLRAKKCAEKRGIKAHSRLAPHPLCPHSPRVRVLLLVLALLVPLQAANAAQEHVILCGGPTLLRWENLRVKNDRHDRWWANFIRASTIRIDELRR